MTHEFVVYVDEAGDDGFGKLREESATGQSRWFVVGAVSVRAENDRQMVSWRDEISASFPNRQRQDIHFKHLNHDQRRHACRIIGSRPLRVAAVLSNKATLLDLPAQRLAAFKRKNHLHNYLCRYLLERVSASLRTYAVAKSLSGCRAKVVFSKRGGMSYDDFRDYLRLIKDGREVIASRGAIDWSVIDPDRIEALDHASRAGLQVADIATSAMFKAVEPNTFGICEQSYADELRRVVWRRNACAFDCGVTHVPALRDATPLTDAQRKFFESWK